MSILYERLSELCERNGITGYRMCKDCKLSPSTMTDLKSGRKKTLSADSAERIAAYFGVSVSYLLGTEKEKAPGTEAEGITDEQLKFALFGDAAPEITDAQLNDVKRYAKFIMNRE